MEATVSLPPRLNRPLEPTMRAELSSILSAPVVARVPAFTTVVPVLELLPDKETVPSPVLVRPEEVPEIVPVMATIPPLADERVTLSAKVILPE
jgi:hypothetical protein